MLYSILAYMYRARITKKSRYGKIYIIYFKGDL
jgi:hypothetical protein